MERLFKTLSIISILILTFGIDTASFAQKYNGMSITINGVSFNMIYVEGGSITVGNQNEDDVYASFLRGNSRTLTVDNFYIGETEVTCGLWNAVFGYDSIVEKKVKVKHCKISEPKKVSNTFSTIENQLDSLTALLIIENQLDSSTIEPPSIDYQDWDDKWTQPINNKVFGTVVDETGELLPGVIIREKDTEHGTITDIDGFFKLDMQNVDHKLEFTYNGYVTKETSAGGNMNVVLKPQPIELFPSILFSRNEPKYDIRKIQPKGDNYPVGWKNSDSINEFLQKLNSITGLNFRLPTSDEWEFAACGGNKSHGYKYSGSNIYEEVGQPFKIKYLTYPVKGKAPNELGIYDMSGNVDELCIDYKDFKEYYNYYDFGDYRRSSVQTYVMPRNLSNLLGFRIVLSSQTSEE